MKWSQLKKRIEDTFADSVKGRVEVWNTRYRGLPDDGGKVWITIDKTRVHSMATMTYWVEAKREADRLAEERGIPGPYDFDWSKEYWEVHREALRTMEDRGVLPAWDVTEAFFEYLNMSMDEILKSDHPFIRAIGMLDRRLGKRRLRALDVKDEHPLVRMLYEFRCLAEGLTRGAKAAS